jgi:acyl-CoA reductase-like NAD-dependent aldehyde dehydrogenase
MKMIIDGKPADASNGAVIEVINPANGKVIDTVPAATEEDVARAVEKAKQGQKKWAQVPVSEKGEILLKFVALAGRGNRNRQRFDLRALRRLLLSGIWATKGRTATENCSSFLTESATGF